MALNSKRILTVLSMVAIMWVAVPEGHAQVPVVPGQGRMAKRFLATGTLTLAGSETASDTKTILVANAGETMIVTDIWITSPKEITCAKVAGSGCLDVSGSFTINLLMGPAIAGVCDPGLACGNGGGLSAAGLEVSATGCLQDVDPPVTCSVDFTVFGYITNQ